MNRLLPKEVRGQEEALEDRSSHQPRRADLFEKSAQVNAYQQKTEWSCSAATLKAAANHFGYDLEEEAAIEAIGASQGRGAETTDIVEGAKKLGFEAWEGSYASLEAAKDVLREGIPIIADVQSFNYPGKGHYILIAGWKPGRGFIVMDPNTKGKTAVDNWRILSEEEMEARWWDRAMAPPHELMPKWGVMIMPKEQEKVAYSPYGNALRRAMAESNASRNARDNMGKFSEGDRIPGGLYDRLGKDKPKLPPDQLRKGVQAELEHTSDKGIAKEIARDHLVEDPQYYTKLEKMEKLASGDMIDYFNKHPKKYKEYLERQKAKKARKEKRANDPIKKKLKVHGINIWLEWLKGEERTYYNHDPLKKSSKGELDYKTKMKADYGYVPKRWDADGEDLDVYLGPNHDSEKVFVIKQIRPSDGSFDEHKIMLGYDSMDEAKKSYLDHMPKKFFGSISSMPLHSFKKKFILGKPLFDKKASKAQIFGGLGGAGVGYLSGKSKKDRGQDSSPLGRAFIGGGLGAGGIGGLIDDSAEVGKRMKNVGHVIPDIGIMAPQVQRALRNPLIAGAVIGAGIGALRARKQNKKVPANKKVNPLTEAAFGAAVGAGATGAFFRGGMRGKGSAIFTGRPQASLFDDLDFLDEMADAGKAGRRVRPDVPIPDFTPDFARGAKTQKEVKQQFRERARKVHSDLSGGSDEAMKNLNKERDRFEATKRFKNMRKEAQFLAFQSELRKIMEKDAAS